MKQYLDLMRHVRQHGIFKSDRTGTGTYSVFGYQMRFDLADGFPLVTTKKIHLKSVIHELLWFLKGNTNTKYLKDNGVSIWDEWADENGNLGPVYGYQWRSWDGFKSSYDQIGMLIEQIKNNPDSRRMIVSAWNVADLDDMALPPCHVLFQFYSRERSAGELWQAISELDDTICKAPQGVQQLAQEMGIPRRILSCQLYQRSADIFLGVPFNIASYALLVMMIAQVTNHAPGEFIWTGGDCHLYSNHLEQVDLQLSREPLSLPTMRLNSTVTDIDGFTINDFLLLNYEHHPHIPAPVAV